MKVKTFNLFVALMLVAGLVLVVGQVPVARADTITVCASGCDYTTIQDAIDASSNGDIINVAAGTYGEPVNIENRSGLTIEGADKTTVIIQPTSVLDFNVGGYGSSRTAVFRIVNSTDIVLQNMTMDLDLVKANFVHGILYWDSTGMVHSNILKNLTLPDVGGGYYEIGSDFRAPGYTDSARANITISDNTFIDTGRIGVVTHDYVDATVTGNTFYKTTDDFGYAIEIGGPSIATISDNAIYGFDTPAASDGSESAGIYVENAWTTAISGVTKNVLVENNEIYDSQYGFWIGNGYNGFAGDVDINVTLNNNNIHDNVEGGAIIQDEDKENGSSVSVNGWGNTWENNGDYGYYIFTQGDGDITVDLANETITGHDTGVYVEDTGGSSSSSYGVSMQCSNIEGNMTYGINNVVSGLTANAENNWWGHASGPTHSSNPSGTGDAVSDNVDFDPWATSAPPCQLSLGFYNITNNNAGDAAIGEAQLFVDVESIGGQVLFTFRNTGPAASSITDVYFDDDGDVLLGIAAIDNTDSGVSFTEGATPPNLPGGTPFGFSADFSADSDPPAQPSGVNPGESLGILFDLEAGKTFADVLADLASEELRIGIHVQGFSSGGSESFVNTPPSDEPPEGGKIIIIKDADPADGTDFQFVSSLGLFTLDDAADDDGDGYSSSITFTDLESGIYSVAEVILPGGDWELASVVCSDPSGGTVIFGPTATINLEGTETVVCAFTNAKLTAIELASFTAKPSISSVLLAWETGTEVDNVGFNLYRAATPDGPYTQINAALIAADGDPVAGASYSFLDKGLAAGTYYYQLEDIDLNGTATLHGPVSVKVLPSMRRPSYRPAVP